MLTEYCGWKITILDARRLDYSVGFAIPPIGSNLPKFRSNHFDIGCGIDMAQQKAYDEVIEHIEAQAQPTIISENGMRLELTSNSRRPMEVWH